MKISTNLATTPLMLLLNTTSTPNCSSSENCHASVYDDMSHGLTKLFSFSMAAIFILIIVTSIFSNCLLVFVIVYSRRLHSITHVFIVNLAVGDMITTLFVIPFDVNFMLTGIFTDKLVLCAIMQTTFLMSLPLAVWNLFLLTVERYVTIKYPFKREKLFTKRNIFMILSTTWCYTLGVSLYFLLHDKEALYVDSYHCELDYPISYSIFHVVANFLAPMTGTLLLNFLVFKVAKQHEKRIATTLKDSKKHQRKLLSFRKAARRILLLVGVCILSTLVFIILVTWNILCKGCHPRQVTWVGNAINYISVSLNPILYGVLNASIRKEIKAAFCVRSQKKEQILQTSSNMVCKSPNLLVPNGNQLQLPLSRYSSRSDVMGALTPELSIRHPIDKTRLDVRL